MIRLVFISVVAFLACVLSMAPATSATNYSSGTYGGCEYGSCSISLASQSAVAIDVTPASGATRCTVQSDLVTVTTGSSTGYTVTLNNGDATTALDGPDAQMIPSVGGTQASPVTLTANTWGYRIDDVASFGAGPTSPLSSAGVPVLTFAATPAFGDTGATVRYTDTVDTEEVSTEVWYGVCVDASAVAGDYSDDVLYTAIIN